MSKSTHTVDMCTGSVLKKVLLFALPLMLSGILRLLFNAVDCTLLKVFAVCVDGDQVLVTKEGQMLRVSHEAPEITNEWQSIPQFFFDAISENE